MRRNLLKIVSAVAMVVCLFSCFDRTPKNNEFQYAGEAIGFVKRYGDNQNIDIVQDNLDTLRTSNTKDLDPEKFTDGLRVISRVYVNKMTLVGKHYVFNTLVENIMPIPVKTVLDLSYVNSDPERIDSVGHDAILIKKAIVSGNYLDIHYLYKHSSTGDKKHNITFVADDEKSDNSRLYLEMRHNADNDEGAEELNGILSVDIKKYLDNAANKKLRIELISYDGTEDRSKVIEWEWFDYNQ